VFFIRDLHLFDERIVSATHDTALVATSLAYETLPIMDWALWSKSGGEATGMWPVLLNADGTTVPMAPDGTPSVKELNSKTLKITQPIAGGGIFSITCSESEVDFAAVGPHEQSLQWAWNLTGGTGQKAVVRNVAAGGVLYQFGQTSYRLSLKTGSCKQLIDGTIQLGADAKGKLGLILK